MNTDEHPSEKWTYSLEQKGLRSVIVKNVQKKREEDGLLMEVVG